MRPGILRIAVVAVVAAVGCASTPKYAAIPTDLDRSAVPHKTIEMTAQKFRFEPETIRVEKGTLVTLRVKAVDTDHGFYLPDFGIDEELPHRLVKKIEFYAPEEGSFPFHCSVFCGLGHWGMEGLLVVE